MARHKLSSALFVTWQVAKFSWRHRKCLTSDCFEPGMVGIWCHTHQCGVIYG